MTSKMSFAETDRLIRNLRTETPALTEAGRIAAMASASGLSAQAAADVADVADVAGITSLQAGYDICQWGGDDDTALAWVGMQKAASVQRALAVERWGK